MAPKDFRTCANFKSFPKSNFFAVGERLAGSGHFDLGSETFKRGAESSCVACMEAYITLSSEVQENMIHLRYPWLLEGAIRGNIECMRRLIVCYAHAEPCPADSLMNYWSKIMHKCDPKEVPKETIQNMKKKKRKRRCIACPKDSIFHCGMCNIASYCSKECQLDHWSESDGNHIGECRQIQILKQYHKPYAESIYRAISRGDDPKEIFELQELRNRLGLNRPKEEYEELLMILNNDDDTTTMHPSNNNRNRYVVARKDGTVHIGSTPEVI
jgi:hypothetical protein